MVFQSTSVLDPILQLGPEMVADQKLGTVEVKVQAFSDLSTPSEVGTKVPLKGIDGVFGRISISTTPQSATVNAKSARRIPPRAGSAMVLEEESIGGGTESKGGGTKKAEGRVRKCGQRAVIDIQ